MNTRLVRIATLFALVFALGTSAAATRAEMLDGPKLLVTGKVTATGEFVSPGLGRFRIVPENQGDELLKHPGELVTVEGVVVENDDGTKLLYVDVFKKLDASP